MQLRCEGAGWNLPTVQLLHARFVTMEHERFWNCPAAHRVQLMHGVLASMSSSYSPAAQVVHAAAPTSA